jgi:hypothetical protein
MGSINLSLANGIRFTALGKEWVILPPKQKSLGQFEQWLERRAFAKLSMLKDTLDAEEYAEMRTALMNQITSCYFSWGTDVCKEALKTHEGILEFALILFKQSHPELTREKLEELVTTEGFLDSFEAVLNQTLGATDPNQMRATQLG